MTKKQKEILSIEVVEEWIEKYQIGARIDLWGKISKVGINHGLKTTKNNNLIILATQLVQLAIDDDKKSST